MRATRALIHLDNFRHNLGIIRGLCPDSKICLAVKANAYGHGAVVMARAAVENGVHALGVATVDEAAELRNAGIVAPIILYGIAAWDELPTAISRGVELFCTDHEQMDAIGAAARLVGKRARIHLKVDTGMGRIGCDPSGSRELAKASLGLSVDLVGICTHFPVSENPDPSYTDGQIGRFKAIVDEIRADGIDPGLVHAANSGGLGLFAEARMDMVRPGIMAYGYAPGDEGFGHLDLRPVMELRSAVSFIKAVETGTPISYGHRYQTPGPSWIATVPVGYADGLPRVASGRIGFRIPPLGDNYPQVGTICMDQCMVNLGPSGGEPPVARWDEVVIFGPQPGAETAATIARAAGTIPYEITCGISLRVPRVYIG
jgi:alanine racemase